MALILWNQIYDTPSEYIVAESEIILSISAQYSLMYTYINYYCFHVYLVIIK